MPVWIKRVALVVLALLALLLAGAVYLVATFDPNRHKDALVEWVRVHKQRTLAIEGPISLSLLPRLAVTLRDVRLSEHRSEENFATVREASLAVQLWPLLRRELIIDRLSVDGASVRYARDAARHRNIDDLLADAAPSQPGDPGGGGLRFDISSISLRNVEATIRDTPAGVEGTVAIVELNTGRIADGVSAPVKLLARATLTRPALQAGLDLRGDLTLRLPPGEHATARLRNFHVALDGQALGYRDVRATLGAEIDYDGPSGSLRVQDARLSAALQRAPWTLSEGSLRLQSLSFQPPQRRLTLEGLVARATARDATRQVVAELGWPTLNVDGDQMTGSPLRGEFNVKGTQQVAARFTTGAPSGRFESIRVPDLTIVLEGTQGDRRIASGLTGVLTIKPQPMHLALAGLNAHVTVTDTGSAPWTLRTRGSASAGTQRANWDLLGTLQDQAYTTTGQVTLGGARPRVEANARFNDLDLRPFMTSAPAASGAGGAEAKGSTPKPAPGDQAIEWAALRRVDGRFQLQAETLRMPTLQAQQVRADARVQDGELRVTGMGARAWGGQFTGTAQASAARRQLSLNGNAQGVRIGDVLESLGRGRQVEGTGRVQMDLASGGDTVAALTAGLNGLATVELRDGTIRGVNLAQSLRRARAALGGADESQPADQALQTDFTEIKASFRLTDGVAHNRDLQAYSPFLRATGEGRFDLVRQEADYTARLTVTASAQGQGADDLAALRGLTVPVRIAGPFDALRYGIRWSEVARGAAGQAVRQTLEQALKERLEGGSASPAENPAPADNAAPKSLEERLKEGLRGLLR